MCTKPSTPPISTKAPNFVSDLTTPVYVLPTSTLFQNSSASFFFCSLITAAIEPTIFVLPLFFEISIILRSTVRFCNTDKSARYLSDANFAGTKILPPLTATKTPPFKISTTLPVSIVPFSKASSKIFSLFIASIFLFESVTSPSTSLTLTTKTSISSPTFINSQMSASGSSTTSLAGMKPSDLYPKFTLTPLGSTRITVPLTISPVFKVTRACSFSCSFNTSAKLTSPFTISSISPTTSLIIHGGVDAPAVIPILFFGISKRKGKSLTVSI